MKKKIILIISTILIILAINYPFSVITASAATEIVIYNNKKEAKKITFTSQDITAALKEAFDYCRNNATKNNTLKITVPKGEYTVKSAITLSSNTILHLLGVTLINNGQSNTFLSPTGNKKYSGLCNFRIEYGTLTYHNSSINKTTMIRLAHCKNVTLTNVEFKDSKGTHFMELAGSKNIQITNCIFRNLNTKNNMHALQIDILEETQHFRNMPPYDNTMNKNITVSNCLFESVPIGVGTNSMFEGYYQDGINIQNNVFTNIRDSAITCTAFVNSRISGNIIENCSNGIKYFMMKNDDALSKVCYTNNQGRINYNSKSIIEKNIISCKDTAILCFGNTITNEKALKNKSAIQRADYPVSNIKIKNNTIDTKKHGIMLYDTKKSDIVSNRISSTNKNIAIGLFDHSQINNIKENTITGTFEFGIYNSENSEIDSILNNSFTDITRHAIINYGSINRIYNNAFNHISSFCIYYPIELCGYIYNNKYNMSYAGKVLY